MTSGKFITFEGTEGVGKSTQSALLESYLRKTFAVEVVATREPGGTQLGEAVRGLLLDPELPPMDSTAELLLMFAARAEHIKRVIEPALSSGHWVICDRFTDATYAYQGGGRAMDSAKIARLEQIVQGELQPDLTIVIDLELDIAEQRARERGKLDRFEREQRDFFARVRNTYLERAQRYSERFAVVDGAAEIDAVHRSIVAAVGR